MLRLAALVCLFIFSAHPFAADNVSAPQHSLWSLKGKSNTIYFLGSVHFLRPTDELPPIVKQAYRESEKIIMELDMDDLDPAQQTTLELGLLPAGRTLESEVGAEAYRKVATEAKQLGIDAGTLNRFRPWLAGLTLVQMQLIKHGLDPASGVEQRLVGWARKDGKPITGLETLPEQLGLLAGMPDKLQREFLLYSVEDAEHVSEQVETLISAWRTGNTQVLERILSEGFDQYPDLYRPLTIERNRRWLKEITELLDDRDDYLVVVGTLHLIGDDSVLELLQRQGHRIVQH
jgi:uncharacterized protein YbaP (TraB family)